MTRNTELGYFTIYLLHCKKYINFYSYIYRFSLNYLLTTELVPDVSKNAVQQVHIEKKRKTSICPQPPLMFVLVSLFCCHWSTAVTIYIKLQYNSLKHLQFLYWSKHTCWEEKPQVSGHTLISRWTWAVLGWSWLMQAEVQVWELLY